MPKLFVTHIYHKKMKTDLEDLKGEILQIQKADKQGQKWSRENYPKGFTSYGSWDQLHRMSSGFADLEKKIDLHVGKFVKTLGYDVRKKSLRMNSIWVNIMPAGSLHPAHIHPLSVLSGTYYVATPEAASAIKFEDPRLALFMNSPAIKATASIENRRFFSVQPKAGDLILFESWLRHEVPLNPSKAPRISVSFNYNWA